MLQYLINVTTIWLLCMLAYDTLLRREAYHAYNRFYLLTTLFAGAVIPLFPVYYNDVANAAPVLTQSLQQVTRAKTAVAELAAAPQQNWSHWLPYVYAAGVAASLCWLGNDIIKLIRIHRSGTQTKRDEWKVIETGKEHAPFSFGNTLYVSCIASYSGDEWNMLSAHERRHTTLLHIVDLVLMHFARIVFWFHPLVYVYHRRLLMVHEYQADSVAETRPNEYGTFLIEQAILNSAPSITHSFNRSPIKNRILMLTRKSHSFARVKKLIVIPIVAVSVFYCSFAGYTQSKRKESSLTFANSTQYKMTYHDILANPMVGTSKPGCTVASCTISFLPKGEDILGPFRCPGGQMHPRLVDYLKAYKGENIKIFIEDIMLTCNGNLDSLEMPHIKVATEKL